jgi:hypothetical protein
MLNTPYQNHTWIVWGKFSFACLRSAVSLLVLSQCQCCLLVFAGRQGCQRSTAQLPTCCFPFCFASLPFVFSVPFLSRSFACPDVIPPPSKRAVKKLQYRFIRVYADFTHFSINELAHTWTQLDADKRLQKQEEEVDNLRKVNQVCFYGLSTLWRGDSVLHGQANLSRRAGYCCSAIPHVCLDSGSV